MNIDQLAIYRDKLHNLSVPECIQYLLSEIDRVSDELTVSNNVLAEFSAKNKKYKQILDDIAVSTTDSAKELKLMARKA